MLHGPTACARYHGHVEGPPLRRAYSTLAAQKRFLVPTREIIEWKQPEASSSESARKRSPLDLASQRLATAPPAKVAP
jgi:hypothetical protein